LSLSTMAIIAVPVEILINAVAWLVCASIVLFLWRKVKRQ
jgi:hypothetical protein